jgi:hypothetical protein
MADIKGSISFTDPIKGGLTLTSPIPVTGEVSVSGSVKLQRQGWEYKEYLEPNVIPGSPTAAQILKILTIMNKLGVDGWELVSGSLDTRMLFKRSLIQ